MRPILLTAAFLFATGPAWSQIKYPIFDESGGKVQNVVFEEATQHSDYQSGKLLRVTLKNDTTVKGVLVRTDPVKKTIYLRTRPGALPQAVPVNDVKRIDKGVIKQVSTTRDVDTPEIQELVIYNGASRRVAYSAPTLSPSEHALLGEMAVAENNLARLEQLASVQQQVLANDVALQTEQVKARELGNQLLAQQVLFNVYRSFYEYTPGRSAGAVAGAAEAAAALANEPLSALPLIVRSGPSVFPELPITLAPLAKARQDYLTLRNQAVFENGHLVAVIVAEPAEKAPAKNP